MQMGPGVADVPNHHQEVARAQAPGLLERRERTVGLAAETVGNAQVPAREARIWVKLYRALQPLDRFVVPICEQLVQPNRVFRGGGLGGGSDGTPTQLP